MIPNLAYIIFELGLVFALITQIVVMFVFNTVPDFRFVLIGFLFCVTVALHAWGYLRRHTKRNFINPIRFAPQILIFLSISAFAGWYFGYSSTILSLGWIVVILFVLRIDSRLFFGANILLLILMIILEIALYKNISRGIITTIFMLGIAGAASELSLLTIRSAHEKNH